MPQSMPWGSEYCWRLRSSWQRPGRPTNREGPDFASARSALRAKIYASAPLIARPNAATTMK
jgi:hypothetical protein